MKIRSSENTGSIAMYKIAGDVEELEIVSGAGFQEHLVSSLINEHEQILKMLDQARQFAALSKFSDLDRQLKVFNSKLQTNVTAKNVKIYLYLRIALRSDPSRRKLVETMRKEMKSLANNIDKVCAGYDQDKISGRNVDACAVDLKQFKQALSDRFRDEESCLFPLYQPY